MPKDYRKYVIWISVFILGLTAGYFLNQRLGEASSQEESFAEKRRVFQNAVGYVRDLYVDPEEISPDSIYYGAIEGVLNNLDDPHSRLLKPQDYKQMQTEINQEFGGLGIYITIRNGRLTVIAPIQGTPAFKAGLQPGDKILAINGKSTEDIKKTQTAVKKLRGPKGSDVQLTIGRGKKVFDVTITRGEIPIKSVYYSMIEDKKRIGYIEIKNFGEETASEVKDALKSLHEQGMKGLIVDLRNNPGGSLQSGHKVADIWIDEGLTVYTRGRAPGQDKDFKASSKPSEPDYPMAVLTNKGSASGSEIVAGALKDHNRAIVMGDTTFGKGSVQSVFPLNDESALALTTAYWYTPDGHLIQDEGITPDVRITQETPDTVTRRDLAKLTRGDTVLNFVKKHNNNPSEKAIIKFIDRLRSQGFELDARYIRHQIRRKELAMKGERLVADLSTDPQLRKAYDYFVSHMRNTGKGREVAGFTRSR